MAGGRSGQFVIPPSSSNGRTAPGVCPAPCTAP